MSHFLNPHNNVTRLVFACDNTTLLFIPKFFFRSTIHGHQYGEPSITKDNQASACFIAGPKPDAAIKPSLCPNNWFKVAM